jgi:hypothetical protein
MADILQDGLALLATQMKAYVSTTITYRRGSKQVDVLATLGSSIFTLDEVEGTRRTYTSIDFDIQAADLVWDAVVRTPERGDNVILDGRVYEVSTPSTQERVWKWLSGMIGVRFRVHTKQIGTE